MRVEELMEKQVHTCSQETNLETVAMMMWDHNCGAIPVVDDNGMPVGIITDRDITMGSALNHKPLWDLATGEITNSREVFTCNSEDDVRQALSVMQNEKVRRIPVVDDYGRLEGMLSIDDLVSAAKSRKSKNAALSFDELVGALKEVCDIKAM